MKRSKYLLPHSPHIQIMAIKRNVACPKNIRTHDKTIISPAIAATSLDPSNDAIIKIELSIITGITTPATVKINRARSWDISAANIQQGLRFAPSIGVADVGSNRTDI